MTFSLRDLSIAGGVIVTGLLMATAPARADLRVCNQSSNQVSIALGYRANKGWQTEGWWVAPTQKCALVYQGDLHSRFFYLYVADDIGGGAWDGTNFMCTRDESFSIFGVGDCLARGYERSGFLEIDTQNRADWTLKLIDPTTTPQSGTKGTGPTTLNDGSSALTVTDPGAVPPTSGDVPPGDTRGMD